MRGHPEDDGDLTLGIDAQGNYYLNTQPIDAASLAARLEAFYLHASSDHVLYVRADRRLHYGKLLAAVATARESGVRVIAMVTDRIDDAAANP